MSGGMFTRAYGLTAQLWFSIQVKGAVSGRNSREVRCSPMPTGCDGHSGQLTPIV